MTDDTSELPDYLTSSELAERWGKSTHYLQQLRYRGTGPKFIKLRCNCAKYAKDDVLAYEATKPHLPRAK